jgi:DNA polymerase-3 subunit gamma/tau
MSYIVLARKWRPNSFDDLIGQNAVVKTLKNALSVNRLAHAYLFSGPRGVGKTSSARILARALNCESGKGPDPCNECASCKSITDGASVDVIEIDGASNNSVEAVRELRETVKYAPSSGKYKIYIIDEVHMLSQSAFNALLKTLEEPPPHVVFVFATTEPRKIPATILSRCQHHAFRRIPKKVIISHLKNIAETENINIDDQALDMIARAADGSIRDSLTLLDQAIAFSNEITADELQKLLGLPDRDVIRNMTDGIINADIPRCLSIIKDLSDNGNDLRQFTRDLVEHFRDIAMAKISGDADALLEMSSEEVEVLQKEAAGTAMEQLTLLLSELLRIEGELRSALNPRYILELGILRTSFIKGMVSIDTILKKLDDGGVNAQPAEIPPTNAHEGDRIQKKTEFESPASQEITDQDIWQKLIERIESSDHLLACKLSEAKFVKIKQDEISIGFNGGMSFLASSVEKQSSQIKPILRELSGRNLKLRILSLPGNAVDGNKTSSIKAEASSDLIVQEALKRFNSSVVRIKALPDEGSMDQQDDTGGS